MRARSVGFATHQGFTPIERVLRPMRLPHFLRTARMAGTSIAAPDAAAWVTDFLNAAYYGAPA